MEFKYERGKEYNCDWCETGSQYEEELKMHMMKCHEPQYRKVKRGEKFSLANMLYLSDHIH